MCFFLQFRPTPEVRPTLEVGQEVRPTLEVGQEVRPTLEVGQEKGGPMDSIMRNLNKIYIGVAVAAIVIALILCVDYGISRKAEKSESAQTATTIAEKEKKDKVYISVSTETIQDGLANMGVLVTQEYYFTQVERYTKEKTFLKFITTSSEFIYSYDGHVMAGVDFEKIQIEKDEDRKTIIVTIPKSEIIAVTIDKDTFKIYSEKESLWNPLKLEDYNISLVEFENAAKEKALAGGILDRSDEQARNLVREFIISLPNTSEYAIEFK